MQGIDSLESRIAANYSHLSEKLRQAADFVVSNPLDIATRSLRSVADASDVSPATFSRLSRAIGFETYEDMRDLSRASLSGPTTGFSERAARLAAGDNLLGRQAEACMQNIERMVSTLDAGKVTSAAARLSEARTVMIYGALGSTGIAEYMAYLASFFTANWKLVGRAGASVGSDVADLTPEDVLVVITKTPYARRAVTLAEAGKAAGASILILTDYHACPALAFADFGFIVPSESPQFFSSYAATLVLVEALVAQVVARAPDDASTRIARIEAQNRDLGEYPAID